MTELTGPEPTGTPAVPTGEPPRERGISPWVVFAALLFWAYVLGPMGMILAIPLTVALKLGLEMSDRTKWLAALMA